MTDYQDILVETPAPGVGLIRLNRPDARNALSRRLMDEVVLAASAFDADAAVGAIVITGNEKFFSAGADIKEMAGAGAVEMMRSGMIESWNRLRAVKKPLIAAVSGHCLGGGNELAMMCDIMLAAENARFGQPEINIGVIPGAGGTQRLTHAVGKSLAMEVILNDRRLTAQEALQAGLVSRVVPVERVVDEAVELAAQIAQRAPLGVQMAKAAVNKAYDLTLQEGLEFEKTLFYFLFSTEDQKEGMRAFAEKRKPEWKGQ
jgi:enoyl-CoA hydratase